MAGAQKRRQQKDRKANEDAPAASGNGSSSNEKSSPSPPDSGSPTGSHSPPTKFDGNRDPVPRRDPQTQNTRTPAQQVAASGGTVPIQNRNIEVGGAGQGLMSGLGRGLSLPQRTSGNSGNKTGVEVRVKLNSFNCIQMPTKPVYQWDVIVGKGDEKLGLVRKALHSKAVVTALGKGWIFDNARLGWSLNLPDGKTQVQFTVDMDAEQGKEPRRDRSTGQIKENKTVIVVKKSKEISFATLQGYLDGTNDFDISCLEAINFLDHLMREGPSQHLISIRQSFFSRGTQRKDLGQGLEAFKGVYASMRLGRATAGPDSKASTTINVDVNNTAFWKESSFVQVAMEMQLGGGRNIDPVRLSTILAAGKQQDNRFVKLSKLKKLMVYTTHIKTLTLEEQKARPFKVRKLLNETATQHMLRGITINPGDPERDMTVMQYFQQKWGYRIRYPDLPLVEMDKRIGSAYVVLPMELLYVAPSQKFIGKLNDTQTTEMMKFAVNRPAERWRDVQAGVDLLNWGSDQYMANYGLKISPNPVLVTGRLLPAPEIQYAGNGVNRPGTLGKWDLRGKKFYKAGSPILRWGICLVQNSISKQQAEAFAQGFTQTMMSHGLLVKSPPYIEGVTGEPGDYVFDFWKKTGNHFNNRPQILLFVVGNKDQSVYERIKRNCECRPNIGVCSQVMLAKHLERYNAQYGSNVAMKMNCKLGGVSGKAMSKVQGSANGTLLPAGSMFIGGDVTHGTRADTGIPGQSPASIAALAMTSDTECIKYWAACQTNGIRVEMITKSNIEQLIGKLFKKWLAKTGGKFPSHVFYVRDGVSEGQYNQVLNQELADMKSTFASIDARQASNVKWVCLVGTKRHHVRFFPDKGDGDGNALPGTLVETGVTHPREMDFYLCAHKAIKGTARPVHYQVLANDSVYKEDRLPNIIYEASYQYVKSTTPISLHPATYYAHLAAARARAHEDTKATAGADRVRRADNASEASQDMETYPLMPHGGTSSNATEDFMWFC